MIDMKQFREENEIRNKAINAKMVVVGILVLSVIVFTIIGKESTKSIIWYWVAFMGFLLVICIIQDIIVARKIKALREARNNG